MGTPPTTARPTRPPPEPSASAPIIGRTPVPFVEVQGSAHVVSDVNPAFCRLLKKSREALLGQPFATLVPSGADCVQILDDAYATGAVDLAGRVDRPESDPASWLYALWPTRDPDQPPVGVILQLTTAANFRQDAAAVNEALLISGLHQLDLNDTAENLNVQLRKEIGERAEVEAALRVSEARLSAVLGHLPVGVSLVGPDGKTILLNPPMRRFMPDGLPSRSPQRVGRWQAVRPDGTPLAPEQWPGARALRGETVVPGLEFLFTEDDGRQIWTSVATAPMRAPNGEVSGVVVMVQDIDGRKRAGVALRRSEERYRTLFELGPIGVYSCDATGTIREYNARASELWGNKPTPGESGEHFWAAHKVYRPDGSAVPQEQHPVTEVLRGKVPMIRDLELVLGRPDGSQITIVANISPLKDELGNITGAIKCFYDVTDRKQADVALHQAVERLKQAQTATEAASRAKDDFLAALSHELRTPLTPVLMTAAALCEDEGLPYDARQQLGMMARNIALEARLIDDLLDLTAISRGKLLLRAQPCDAHSLIDLAVGIVGDDARAKGVAIERDFTAAHSGLNADPARFQQVIWNLLRNAVKFTPHGGHISITTRETKTPGGATWLRIEVADSGVGIDPAFLEQIFVPFEQVGLPGGHRFGGLGLGLAIARAVVDLHGGRISAESAGPDRGATFVIELPGAFLPEPGVSEAVTLLPFVSPRPPPKVPIAPLRLLLVEDHENTLQTISRLLRLDGHHVVTAATIAAGLAAATGHEFDLVISDLGLPDGSGTELMAKLRDTYGLRGIALSGYGMEEDLRRSHDAGFVTHLVKPVSMSDLRRVIAALPPVQQP